MDPLLSIITINLNNKTGLQRTLESINTQKNKNFEYLVIDGGSTDGSINLLNTYKYIINKLIIEKDTGIYNAMNKGILASKGNYCLFINSGDCLQNQNTTFFINKHLQSNDGIYYSDCQLKNGETINYPSKMSLDFLLLHTINHQNYIIKKSILLSNNGYREDLKIVSDWEILIKSYINPNITFKKINDHISIYEGSGLSSNKTNILIAHKERIGILEETFPSYSHVFKEYYCFKNSLFGLITTQYGYSKLLHLILRVFFYFSRKTKKKLIKKNNYSISLLELQ